MTAGRTEPTEADYVAADTATRFDGLCGASQYELQSIGDSCRGLEVGAGGRPSPGLVEVREAGPSHTACE